MSYHLQGKYYGTCAPYLTSHQVREALQMHQIDYFLSWNGRDEERFGFLQAYPEVTAGLIPNLRIYDLKKLTANEKPLEGVEDFDNIPK